MKQELMRLRLSPISTVQIMFSNGLITQPVWAAYCRIWLWSAPRFGGLHGLKHDDFLTRYGRKAYETKINRTRKAFGFQPYY